MHDFLKGQGVKDEDLLLEDKSTTTYENALYARDALKGREIERIVLVTSAGHMRRAVGCFTAQGFQVTPSACDYRARQTPWSIRQFLPSSQGIAEVDRAAHEWLGIAWYWLRGRI